MSDRTVTLLLAEIVLEEPWAIRAPEVGGPLDAPVARDGFGNLYVPPASVAGALRAHLASEGLADQLMGPRTVANDETLSASPLRVVGTDLSEASPSLRQRTAIDRDRGAAAARTLRVQELVEPGARVTVYLRHDGPLPDAGLAALCSWQPRLGGGASEGQGRGRLESLRYGVIDLDTPEGLTLWLTKGGRSLHREVCQTSCSPEDLEQASGHDQSPLIEAGLTIADALLIGVESPEDRVSAEPLTRQGTPVVDGASLKGLLRSRAEYILRSLGHDACRGVTAGKACGRCGACELFGAPDRLGLLSIASSTIQQPTVEKRSHVAIDRVTGGAAEEVGLLFTERVVTSGTLTLCIEARRPVPTWGRLLLLHVLRDIHDGLVGLGRGTTRGQGTLSLTDPSLLAELDDGQPSLVEALKDGAPQESTS